MLFLLDEVLAGTNSHDRQIGAASIVRGLVDIGAIGVVTTHDLALTSIVGALGARAGLTLVEQWVDSSAGFALTLFHL